MISRMNEEFKLTDLGQAKHMIGMKITQTEEGIHIDQGTFALKLIKEFDDNDITVKTSFIAYEDLPTSRKLEKTEVTRYQSIVGSLNYLAMISRPDIEHLL